MIKIVTGDEVKEYLNIVGDDDDRILNREIVAGYGYLEDAVDDFQEIYDSNENFKTKPDAWVLDFGIPDAYDNREGGWAEGSAGMDPRARAMITQLQLYRKE
nr:MAG TPA: hypothetical protein [Caudoviricetes sp.]